MAFRSSGKLAIERSEGVRKCNKEHLVLRGPRKPYFPAQPLSEPYSSADLGGSPKLLRSNKDVIVLNNAAKIR